MASRGGSARTRRGGSARAGARAARTRAPPQRAKPTRAGVPRVDLSATPLRALAERPHLAAALLLALPVLLYLWPVLLGGKVFAATSTLYLFAPWEHLAPADLQSYLNILLSDVPLADNPWRWFARELIRDGTLPTWNPHVFAGVPFFSNPQTGIFTPFNLPLWTLPFDYGLGVSAALKLWVGAFGTYLLVRELRLGFLPGLLAGVGFAFCSLNIVWLTHETLPDVAVMLPWMLWLVERIVARRRLADMLGLAAVTAVALSGGHPGMQVHVLATAGVYTLLRVAFPREAERDARLRALALAGGGLVLGILLVAVVLVPEILSSRGTLGTVARRGGQGELPGTQMPFSVIRTVLFPDWWGRPSGFEAPTSPEVRIGLNYNERTLYAGVVPLLLAAVGLAAQGSWRRKGPFAALAFLGLAIPLHLPGLYWIVVHLPAFELVQNQRLHFVFALAVAVLAAFGLQAVLERPAGDRRRLAVVLVALLVGLVALGTAGASAEDVSHVAKHFLTGLDYESAGVVALTSVVWFLLLALGAGAALLAARRWPQRRTAIGALVVLLVVLDMLHFANGYQPMAPASKAIPPRTPAIAYLQRHADDGRFVGVEYALTADWSLRYGLFDVRGYDPPYPTLRFFRLWRTVSPQQADWMPFTIEGLGPAAVRLVSVLGARYIVAEPGVGPPVLHDRALRPLTPAYRGRDATVLLNENALPRAMVAPAVRLVADEDAARAALVGEGFDPRQAVVVERDQPGAAALASAPPAHGTVVVADEGNVRVTLRASLDRRGLVVLNDTLTDGWSVRVDGREARVLRVNDVMRGVVVGAGRHEVEWSYAVPGLRAGFVGSLVALLGLVGAGGALVVRSRVGRRD